MIRIANEAELLDSFREVDRPEVELPRELAFPLGLKDYLAWVEPAGCRVFLVYEDPDSRKAFGIVFRRDQGGGGAAGMCEWCHSVRSGDGVGLLTASASANRRVGISLCRDLSCREKAESAPGVDDLPQSPNARERVRGITRRMASFARQSLF